jgi:hypothetical protein
VATEPEAVQVQPVVRKQSNLRANLIAGLIVTSPVGALVISVTTGAIFILGVDGVRAVVAGLILGGVVWLGMAVTVTAFLGVERANRSIHKALTARVEAMSTGPMPPSVENQLNALAQELGMSRSSTQSEDERQQLIAQLQNAQR